MSDSPSFDLEAQLRVLVDAIEGRSLHAAQAKRRLRIKKQPERVAAVPLRTVRARQLTKRWGNWHEMRQVILQRDDAKCRLCEESDPDVLEVHHIVPVAEGGSFDHDNLITLCANHHRLAQKGRISRERLYALALFRDA